MKQTAQHKETRDPKETKDTRKELDTTRNAVPYDTGNIPGPKMARAVQPAVAGKMIAKAKRPLLVVGSEVFEEEVLNRVKHIGKKGIPIAAVGNSYKAFAGGPDGLNVNYINMHALASYLCDPDWPGFDGKGNYDLVVILGITYYYASQAIAGVKNFADAKIVSIDRYYHPNADMSFGNLKNETFYAALDEVIAQLYQV